MSRLVKLEDNSMATSPSKSCLCTMFSLSNESNSYHLNPSKSSNPKKIFNIVELIFLEF